MWEGKVTEELRELFRKYMDENHGIPPDGYDELCCDAMTYDEFVGYIKKALELHCEMPDVVV